MQKFGCKVSMFQSLIVCKRFIKFAKVCKSLQKFDQVWSSLIKFEKVWKSLKKFVKVVKVSKFPSFQVAKLKEIRYT